MNLDYSVSGLKPTSIDILTNNSLMKKSFIFRYIDSFKMTKRIKQHQIHDTISPCHSVGI